MFMWSGAFLALCLPAAYCGAWLRQAEKTGGESGPKSSFMMIWAEEFCAALPGYQPVTVTDGAKPHLYCNTASMAAKAIGFHAAGNGERARSKEKRKNNELRICSLLSVIC